MWVTPMYDPRNKRQRSGIKAAIKMNYIPPYFIKGKSVTLYVIRIAI